MLPHGYSVEPARPEIFDEIADLVIACDEAVSGYSEFDAEDLAELSRTPRVDLTADSWLIRHRLHPVAFAMLWDSEPNKVFRSFGVVALDHQGKGLGNYLLDRVEARAARRAVPEAVLRTFIDINEPQAKRLAEERGYRFVRRYWSMLADLPESLPPASSLDGITITACTDSLDDARLVHSLVDETFTDHWGFSPKTFDEFRVTTLARSDTEPSLWFVARAGDEPVGVLVGQMQPEGLGWVADLGVRAGWRKRGIGEALLRHAIAVMHERGARRVGLGVDSGNETGAVRLYERVGMRVMRGDDEYEKAVG